MAAILYILLVVSCYFFYPSWRGFSVHSSAELAFHCWAYLVVVVGLLKWLSYRAAQSQIVAVRPLQGITKIWNKNYLLLAVLLFFAVFQSWFMFLPILSGPDEAEHVRTQLVQWRDFRSDSSYSLLLFSFTNILLLVILSVLLPLNKKFSFISLADRKGTRYTVIILLASLLLLYGVIYSNISIAGHINRNWGMEFRWPPLGTILGVASYSLFGKYEWTSRLIPLLFYLGTGLYLFKIVKEEANHLNGIAAVFICLGSPVFFAYGHLDYRETGGAFFLTFGICYLLRFLKSANLQHLYLCCFAIAAGYLVRRPSLILIFIVPLFLIWDLWQRKKRGIPQKDLLLLAGDELVILSVVVLVVLPWMYLTKDLRPYKLHESNFYDLKIVTAYARSLPGSMTWPTVFLSTVGFLVVLAKRKTAGIAAILIFALLYILFTGDQPYWIPVERFTVMMVPFVAILAAMAVNNLGRWQKHFLPFVIVTVLLGLGSWFFDIKKSWLLPTGATTFSSYPYYPFDKLSRALKDENIPDGKILYPAYWQTASSVYYFFNDIRGYRDVIPAWRASKYRKCSISDLEQRCEQVQCRAVILRLVKRANSTKVAWLTDLQVHQVLSGAVPFFDVVDVFFFRNNGLALLVPKNEKNLIITKSVK